MACVWSIYYNEYPSTSPLPSSRRLRERFHEIRSSTTQPQSKFSFSNSLHKWFLQSTPPNNKSPQTHRIGWMAISRKARSRVPYFVDAGSNFKNAPKESFDRRGSNLIHVCYLRRNLPRLLSTTSDDGYDEIAIQIGRKAKFTTANFGHVWWSEN